MDKIIIAAFLLFNFIFFVPNCSYSSDRIKDSDFTVSINASKTSVKEILVDISRQTQWSILADSSVESEIFSGNYSEAKLDTFISELFRGKNYIALYDFKQKIIEIRSFGSHRAKAYLISNGKTSNLPLSATEQDLFLGHAQALNQIGGDALGEAGQLLTEDRIAEITLLQAEQLKAYEEYKANPDSLEPLTGMTLGQIERQRAQQMAAYDEYLRNPGSLEPITRYSLGQIRAIQENQNKAYEDYLANPNSIEPISGKAIGEISRIREEQEQISEEMRPDFFPR